MGDCHQMEAERLPGPSQRRGALLFAQGVADGIQSQPELGLSEQRDAATGLPGAGCAQLE